MFKSIRLCVRFNFFLLFHIFIVMLCEGGVIQLFCYVSEVRKDMKGLVTEDKRIDNKL